MTRPRFNEPRFSHAGEERIRRAMERGHAGDDPALPIRKMSVRREGKDYISWVGPIETGGTDMDLWEMEIDLDRFRTVQKKDAMKAAGV